MYVCTLHIPLSSGALLAGGGGGLQITAKLQFRTSSNYHSIIKPIPLSALDWSEISPGLILLKLSFFILLSTDAVPSPLTWSKYYDGL